MKRMLIVAFGVIAPLVLTSCGSRKPDGLPFYNDLASPSAQINAQDAANVISNYRRNNGLSAVTLDPALTRAAQRQAEAMARANDVRASLANGNGLAVRLAGEGMSDIYAVENVSAGYRTFAEAFSGWRESSKHNTVMLDPKATRMGIATTYAPGSKYKVFWSLVMAAPQ